MNNREHGPRAAERAAFSDAVITIAPLRPAPRRQIIEGNAK
ncbi:MULTISPECIES: hypothetical protein [unclassified Nonomuraea]